MSYMEFITKVIGLQPDALKSDPNSSCPPTPQIVETVSDQVKKQLFNSPGGRNKLLSIFGKQGGNTVSEAEFKSGVKALNLPLDRKQINHLFKQFERAQESKGEISVMNFTKNLFGMATHRSSASSHKSLDMARQGSDSRPLPTSRGGSPCMPKEFRSSRPRTSLSSPLDYPARPKSTQVPPMAGNFPTFLPPSPGTPAHDNTKLHPMLRATTGPESSRARSVTPTMLSTNRSRV